MAAFRPRIVLSSEVPSLFSSIIHQYQSPEKLIAREVAMEKGPMFLSLFRNAHSMQFLSIPETLVKTEEQVDPVFLMNDDRKGIICIETKAVDAFFNRVKSVIMMTAVSHPSPLDVPQCIVWTEGRIAYCKEQAEVLRLISNNPAYTVQRFIQPRDEHVKKMRVKWSPGSHVVTLIIRKTQIPYNKPRLQSIKKPRKVIRCLPKRRESLTHSLMLPLLGRRKTFTDLAKFQSLAIAKGMVTPYSASFSCPDDCTLVPIQRQDVDEFVHGVVRFLQQKTESDCELLRAMEVDIVQDLLGKLYLLSVKGYTVMKREGLLKLQSGSSAEVGKSPMRRSLEDMKRFFVKPMRSSLSHTRYIDLGDVQDQNISLYSRLSDSLA